MEEKSMNVSPITIMQFDKLLEELVNNEGYMAQCGNITIKYEGTVEDTLFGKRQAFTIVRKIEE